MNRKYQNISTRDELMDNLKALMLFFVAFGHTLDVFKGQTGIEMWIMKYVYLFHMPMFAFITGYFTKNVDKARKNAINKSLVPYIVLQGCYCIVALVMIKAGLASFNADVFSASLILPTSAFYYLLAVFFWKVFAKDILRFKHPLILSVILGVTISLTSAEEFHVGYGAVFSLLPFFVLGLLCTSQHIEKIRSMPLLLAVAILLLGLLPAIYLPYAIHSVRMTYAACDFSNITGMMYRLIFYTIALLMGAALIRVMSKEKTIISGIGKSSLTVYAGSTFLAPHGYILINRFLHLSENRPVNFAGMIIFSAILVFICSLPVFNLVLNQIINWFNKLIGFRIDIE